MEKAGLLKGKTNMRVFDYNNFSKEPFHLPTMLMILWGFLAVFVFAEPNAVAKQKPASIIRSAVTEGKLTFRLTVSDDVKALLGSPVKETTEKDGGMESLVLDYGEVQVRFGRSRDFDAPFALYEITVLGKGIDIGQRRQVVLRDIEDLKKFDRFWGFCNVSLAMLDLRGHLKFIQTMPFDSRTVWPEATRLPEGFDPVEVLEQGKNPGLGIRDLHRRGIDGRGIGIAIIDQPLLKGHPEYADRIVSYETIEVTGVPPQMHGPGVTSIAVGKSCGVAPAANLHYYAVPMWKWNKCRPYCDVIEKILKSNEELKLSERIRVVSISTGMFQHWEDLSSWEATLKKAEQHGVVVLTCSTMAFNYVPMARAFGKDPEDPNSYLCVTGTPGPDFLTVPAGSRTTASHEKSGVYTYWTESGMSWATPYLAGLAALAFQVDPQITPDKIFEWLPRTAVHTDAGSIVNPRAFIACVQDPNRLSTLRAQTMPKKSSKVHVASEPSKQMNEKVAQLDMSKAMREDVIRIFGQPQSYQRDGRTVKEENFPDKYIMTFADGFSVSIRDGRVEELRFQKPGFVFRGSITVGSTLEDVQTSLGAETRVIDARLYRLERGVLYNKEGERIKPDDRVIYKDIGRRNGFCFYDATSTRGVRILFMGNRVVVICISRNNL
jgi:serine protease AprX